MMEPKDFQFLSLLPGLYMMRDMIAEQIQTIEARLGGHQKRKYVKHQKTAGETEKIDRRKKPMSEEAREKLRATTKAKWANMPAAERRRRLNKMLTARRAKQARA